jgi:hypothetical protein
MNKYLLMCSAAVLTARLGSGGALACTTVHFHSALAGDYCDYFKITKNVGGLYAAVHVGAVTCATTSLQYDAGVKDRKAKVPGGGSVQFADTSLAKAGEGWIGLDWDLGTPFCSSPYAVIASENGTSALVVNSGFQLDRVRPGAKALKKSVLHDAIVALALKK